MKRNLGPNKFLIKCLKKNKKCLFTSPGVAGAVLETPSYLVIDSGMDPLWKYIQNAFIPKTLKLGS